jgi:hypothetical protein
VWLSSGTVRDCTFGAGNNALYGYGAGVYMTGGTVTNCTISNGTTGGYRAGGAVAVAGANALVVSCTITNNKPAAWSCYYGAGLYMTAGTVRNTVIAKNELPNYASDGGGVYMTGGRLVNCTIADNKNTVVNLAGGGIGSGGGIFRTGGAITNCIIFGNTTAKAGDDDNIAGPDVTNACWYSCSPGLDNVANSNITANPLFAGGSDYHLQSKYGRWTPTGWVKDAQTSPCIDAGPPLWDFSLETPVNGARINMGAYGGTMYASKSKPPPAGTVIMLR